MLERFTRSCAQKERIQPAIAARVPKSICQEARIRLIRLPLEYWYVARVERGGSIHAWSYTWNIRKSIRTTLLARKEAAPISLGKSKTLFRVELVYTTEGALSSPSRALYVLASLSECRIGEESHFVEREAHSYGLCYINRERSADSDEKGL